MNLLCVSENLHDNLTKINQQIYVFEYSREYSITEGIADKIEFGVENKP